MKSKATLSLIELIIMILVFAVAAASGLRVFTYADAKSEEIELDDFAVTQVRNAAEAVKNCGGDMAAAAAVMEGKTTGESGFEVCYDAELAVTGGSGVYVLTVAEQPSDNEYLGCAEISMSGSEREIYSIEICWQEDVG